MPLRPQSDNRVAGLLKNPAIPQGVMNVTFKREDLTSS